MTIRPSNWFSKCFASMPKRMRRAFSPMDDVNTSSTEQKRRTFVVPLEEDNEEEADDGALSEAFTRADSEAVAPPTNSPHLSENFELSSSSDKEDEIYTEELKSLAEEIRQEIFSTPSPAFTPLPDAYFPIGRERRIMSSEPDPDSVRAVAGHRFHVVSKESITGRHGDEDPDLQRREWAIEHQECILPEQSTNFASKLLSCISDDIAKIETCTTSIDSRELRRRFEWFDTMCHIGSETTVKYDMRSFEPGAARPGLFSALENTRLDATMRSLVLMKKDRHLISTCLVAFRVWEMFERVSEHEHGIVEASLQEETLVGRTMGTRVTLFPSEDLDETFRSVSDAYPIYGGKFHRPEPGERNTLHLVLSHGLIEPNSWVALATLAIGKILQYVRQLVTSSETIKDGPQLAVRLLTYGSDLFNVYQANFRALDFRQRADRNDLFRVLPLLCTLMVFENGYRAYKNSGCYMAECILSHKFTNNEFLQLCGKALDMSSGIRLYPIVSAAVGTGAQQLDEVIADRLVASSKDVH